MKCTILICSLACVMTASAQSFYVDAEFPGGPTETGSGLPSSSFGAAAGIPGVWNGAWWSNDPFPLRDTAGNMTGVLLRVLGGPGGFGYNFPGNTGDFRALLNDTDNVDPVLGPSRYVFTGLLSGTYRVITYACDPHGVYGPTRIEVLGDASGGQQLVTGPMPGNAFALGITHSEHYVSVTNQTLTIVASEAGQFGRSHVNGYQLVLVPEPSSILGVALGISALIGIRRRR